MNAILGMYGVCGYDENMKQEIRQIQLTSTWK